MGQASFPSSNHVKSATRRINPQLSAYAQMFGAFDFNRTPLGPPGTKLVVYENPTVRETWAPHGVDGWYNGPAMHHYRCFNTWIVDTRAEQVSRTVLWFPSQVAMPTASSTDAAFAAACDLIRALKILPQHQHCRPSLIANMQPYCSFEPFSYQGFQRLLELH